MATHSVRSRTGKGNRSAITALKGRRASLAGEIEQFKDDIKHRQEQLAHLDATLRILDPDYRAEVASRRRGRGAKRFAGRELNRLIIEALRGADGAPLSTAQIADAIIALKGLGGEVKPALVRRLSANLSYLLRQRGVVDKIGSHLAARWRIRPDTAGPSWHRAD